MESCASHHMPYNKSLFSETRLLSYPLLNALPNGYRPKSDGGYVIPTSQMTLHKFLFCSYLRIQSYLCLLHDCTSQFLNCLYCFFISITNPFNKEVSRDW